MIKKGLLCRIKDSVFAGDNYIGNLSHVQGCVVGRGTYCGSRCNLINLEIGKFCSISSDVKVIFGEHPTQNWVTTYPGFYSSKNRGLISFVNTDRFEEYKYVEGNRFFSKIGNDVWIGSNALIMSGITIGDGAIIAAGAVVTTDVNPYEIVGGVPAKKIRKRFTDEEIEFLLSCKWWDKDENWLRNNAESFSSFEDFKNAFNK